MKTLWKAEKIIPYFDKKISSYEDKVRYYNKDNDNYLEYIGYYNQELKRYKKLKKVCIDGCSYIVLKESDLEDLGI